MRIDGFYRSLRRRKDERKLVGFTALLPPSGLSSFDAANHAEWSVLSDRKQGNRGDGMGDLAAAGITFKTDSGRADIHALRVSFASHSGGAGVPTRTARGLMRHSTVELTSRIDTKLEHRDVEGAVGRLLGPRSDAEEIEPKATGTDAPLPEHPTVDGVSTAESLPTLLPIAGDLPQLSMAKNDKTMSPLKRA